MFFYVFRPNVFFVILPFFKRLVKIASVTSRSTFASTDTKSLSSLLSQSNDSSHGLNGYTVALKLNKVPFFCSSSAAHLALGIGIKH